MERIPQWSIDDSRAQTPPVTNIDVLRVHTNDDGRNFCVTGNEPEREAFDGWTKSFFPALGGTEINIRMSGFFVFKKIPTRAGLP